MVLYTDKNAQILCYLLQVLLLIIVNCTAEDGCESLTTEIHVTKEEYDDMGNLIRSCSGEVNVNKCEGICDSQVRPSFGTATFTKECFCCRENYLRDRQVTLTHCYTPDGVRLDDEERATMEIRLKEPVQCECYKCRDFSR